MTETVTNTTTIQAENVCAACKSRKKACDKALPACNSCTKRQLHCRYDHVTATARGERKHNPGRSFVSIQTSSSPSSPLDLSSCPAAKPETKPVRIDDLGARNQHDQVHYIIELAKHARDDIRDQYFQTFHRYLPIITPELFHQAASRCRDISEPPNPSPDFIVLLLAMWLIVAPDKPSDSALFPPLARDSLYRATKSLLSQTQSSICTSLPLAQATLLIAICEYASARPKAAYISIMTYVGLARILDLEEGSVGTPKSGMCENGVGIAISMLERYGFARAKT